MMKLLKPPAIIPILFLLLAALPGAGAVEAVPLPQGDAPAGPQVVPADAFWSDQFLANGATDEYGDPATVWVIRKDAASGNLYVGGDFMWAGGVRANGIAKWDGASWSALGNGFDDAVVYDILIDGATIYAAGYFTTAGGVTVNNVAKWNGSAWSGLGTGANVGTNESAYALAKDGSGNLYLGGWFTAAGGSSVPASRIAKWTGTTWSALGTGVTGGASPQVISLLWAGTSLYACGQFTTAGGTAGRNNIARWTGSAWAAMSTGLTDPSGGYCDEVAADGSGNIYAGGYFTSAGGVAGVNHIAMWNGAAWSALGTGADMSVKALGLLGSSLYAGGDFTTMGGVTVNGTAIWNGAGWSTMATASPGELDDVDAILPVDATHIYVGGYFWAPGGITANSIAKWDGAAWSGLGVDNTLRLEGYPSDYPSSVKAVAVDASGRAYAGGEFTVAGGRPANYVAMWDDDHWEALGSGVNYDVQALATHGDTLYVGGGFDEAGGQPANYIAKWDAGGWAPLGGGAIGQVYAISVDSAGNVYAGGSYWTGSGNEGWVSRWDGSTWTSLGTAPNGVVYALALNASGDLYAAGDFTQLGGVSAADVAKWNGATWSALSSGIGPQSWHRVYALAAKGANVYVGGSFNTAGGIPANNIARWDGSLWWAAGSGIPHTVHALAFDSRGVLYVGGIFSGSGGAPGDRIARWGQGAGSSGVWSPLGSGCSDYVYALATRGTDVFAGGEFEEAGGKPSLRFGMWSPDVTPGYMPFVMR